MSNKEIQTPQFRTPIIDRLQARLSNSSLIGVPKEGENFVIDIVQWSEPKDNEEQFCWTVAVIEPKVEGAEFRSINDRLLDVDWRVLKLIVKMSYEFLRGMESQGGSEKW